MPGSIHFTKDWRTTLQGFMQGRTAIVIATERLRSIVEGDWAAEVSFFYSPDGEVQKEWTVVEEVSRKLEEMSFPRDGLIIGIGGGATTDLVGFVSSLWMRGVDWIAVPTTLAGMVDAAIGGKTGINGEKTKNLIGSFHLPIATLIDQSFLETLPERDINAGFAEIIKCGFISDPEILDISQRGISLDSQGISLNLELTAVIERAVMVKERIVSKDLKESGDRAFLNYGHTVGHAIERSMNYTLRHGEAVAIGMVFAASLSRVVHGLSDEAVQLHLDLLRKFHLPVAPPNIEFGSLLELLWRDKKVKDGKLRFVTLRAIGDPVLVEVGVDQLRQALDEHMKVVREG